MAEILSKSLFTVLAIVGTSFLLPICAAVRYGEFDRISAFAAPMVLSWLAAGWFWLRGRGRMKVGAVQNAFVIVGSAWVAISVFGAVPLWLSGSFRSFTDALFESVSGFTTTGASVVADVESLPKCINLWRCLTHWLGGMGVVALAVAIIPILGAGGYRLVQAETSGPEKSKLTTRMGDTAKILWCIYLTLTAAQTVALRCCGMGWFDAVCHALSTLGTGGFSTRNASIAAFGSAAVEWTCTVFMLLASVNFAVYFMLLRRQWRDILENTELKAFVFIVLAAVAGIAAVRWAAPDAAGNLLRHSAFQVATVISTTGFVLDDYTLWHPAAQLLVLTLFLVGGCSSSTAGGVKVIRWAALAKQLGNEFRRLLHPHGVFTLRINGVPGKDDVVAVVGTFIFVYLTLALITALAGTLSGLDVYTSFTAAFSMIGNVGPAFGSLGPTANYGDIPSALKLWYCFAMLAGRLEVYTLLIMVGRSVAGRN